MSCFLSIYLPTAQVSCFLAPIFISAINLATYIMPPEAIETRMSIVQSGIVALVLYHAGLKSQARPMRGLCMAYAWCGRGVDVMWARCGRGVGMVWAWHLYGTCMAHAWHTHGTCTAHASHTRIAHAWLTPPHRPPASPRPRQVPLAGVLTLADRVLLVLYGVSGGSFVATSLILTLRFEARRRDTHSHALQHYRSTR